jgi:Holliday junction resolvasome RuvABC endonuclease subunit
VKAAGLDLSMTSTGLAIVGGAMGSAFRLERVRSKPPAQSPPSLDDRHRRIAHIGDTVLAYLVPAGAPADWPDLVAVEQPAYSKNMGSMHDRSGLWWYVVGRLHNLRVPVVEVPPTTLKLYVTGKGNAEKELVVATTIRRFPHIAIDIGNDQADALGLAGMAARHLGEPIEDTLPTRNLQAMDKIRWPERTLV